MSIHTTDGSGLGAVVLLGLLFAAPWIAATLWFMRGRVRDGELPPSPAERARRGRA
jgi:hypothetical protein